MQDIRACKSHNWRQGTALICCDPGIRAAVEQGTESTMRACRERAPLRPAISSRRSARCSSSEVRRPGPAGHRQRLSGKDRPAARPAGPTRSHCRRRQSRASRAGCPGRPAVRRAPVPADRGRRDPGCELPPTQSVWEDLPSLQ